MRDDEFVTDGAASGELTAALGTKLPLEAERGYHITIEDPGVIPCRPVTNSDAKFVCAPMNMGLRLAGHGLALSTRQTMRELGCMRRNKRAERR